VSGLCPVNGKYESGPAHYRTDMKSIAGDSVTVEMHAQPGDRSCKNEAIGGNHFGPVIIYMSKVANAQTDTGAGSWFKVDEEGYDTTTKKWGTVSQKSEIFESSYLQALLYIGVLTITGLVERQLRQKIVQGAFDFGPRRLPT